MRQRCCELLVSGLCFTVSVYRLRDLRNTAWSIRQARRVLDERRSRVSEALGKSSRFLSAPPITRTCEAEAIIIHQRTRAGIAVRLALGARRRIERSRSFRARWTRCERSFWRPGKLRSVKPLHSPKGIRKKSPRSRGRFPTPPACMSMASTVRKRPS